MPADRVEPSPSLGERATLEAFLDRQRASFARKLDGVAPDRAAEPTVPPSSLSLLGLARHLADVERVWFQNRLAGLDVPRVYGTFEAAFDEAGGADLAEALAVWRAECQRSREVAAPRSLDDRAAVAKAGQAPVTLRWIYAHMIEEYARHLGHADLLRERLDGATGV